MSRLIGFLILCTIFSCEEEEPEWYEIPVTIISPEDRSVFNEGDTVVFEVETWDRSWQADVGVVFYVGNFELGEANDSIYPYRFEFDTGGLGVGESAIIVYVLDLWENASGSDTITIILK